MSTGIIDYASLKTEIANWMHRTDLTSELDTLIQIAEQKFNRQLRARSMQVITTLSAPTRSTALPADYIQMVNLDISASPLVPLKYVTPEQMELYDLQSSTGRPRNYTIIGSNVILSPNPDQTYTLDLEYFQKIPTLVNGANTNNWLILAWPDAYLYGCLTASLGFIADDARGSSWIGLYDSVIRDINREDDDSQYAGSVMRLRTDVGY